jgi:hypothetical protein
MRNLNLEEIKFANEVVVQTQQEDSYKHVRNGLFFVCILLLMEVF